MDLVGSEDKEFLALDAGHVGLMAGPVARGELWPRVVRQAEPALGVNVLTNRIGPRGRRPGKESVKRAADPVN
jgi:hypothetical protein